jgi:hypothetical protein
LVPLRWVGEADWRPLSTGAEAEGLVG